MVFSSLVIVFVCRMYMNLRRGLWTKVIGVVEYSFWSGSGTVQIMDLLRACV